MKEINNVTLRKIADDIFNLYQKEKNGLSYGANVIDELHAGENAHSRILRMLLQYENDGKYPIYASFLDMLSYHCQAMPQITISTPLFSNEEGRIDVLVKEWNSNYPYAIIIENKVCDAGDQHHQIQRYIESLIDDFKDHIFVVYLTKDGQKVVSDDSLTEKAKEYLGISEESLGRYIPIDYKNHILPWLENIVLPNLTIKEKILISSVQLYIDYLKGIFDMRDNEQQITNQLIIKMKNELKIKNLGESIELYQKVDKLKEISTQLMIQYIKEVLKNHLYNPLQNAFPNSEINEEEVQDRRFGFSIKIPEWKKCRIKLTWEGQRQFFGIEHIDFKNNPIDKKTRDGIHDVLPDGRNTDWWPWWAFLKDGINSANSFKIWQDVENGSVFNFFKNWISDVINKTKDIPDI